MRRLFSFRKLVTLVTTLVLRSSLQTTCCLTNLFRWLNPSFVLLLLFWLLAWQLERRSIRVHVELITFCLRKKLGYKLVVCKLKFFVHASHYANVVVVNQVYLFEVQHLRKLSRLVSEEEVGYGLRLER